MINGYAAGHTLKNGVCECGRKLVDIQGLTETSIGQEGIAHAGKLTSDELRQLNELTKKMRDRVNDLFGWRD